MHVCYVVHDAQDNTGPDEHKVSVSVLSRLVVWKNKIALTL